MPNPTVCAVMLVNGREAMVRRAMKCWADQTFKGKAVHQLIDGRGTIGSMRNEANAAVTADIIIHWDSDDWSHPNRITEQVALLRSSGKDCVGYRDMLFWDETPGEVEFDRRFGNEGFGSVTETEDAIEIETGPLVDAGKAWLYENKDTRRPIGTSLCYWRKTWERRPFADLPKNAESTSEYCDWLREVDALGVRSTLAPSEVGGAAASAMDHNPMGQPHSRMDFSAPRMIASIHGGNTTHYDPAGYVAAQQGTSWKRAAAWDEYCRKEMAL